jgi:hypothetical protein
VKPPAAVWLALLAAALFGGSTPFVKLLIGEATSPPFWVAAMLMGMGVWQHLSERHGHVHAHAAMMHNHLHRHDEHHQHVHDFPWDGQEPHSHPHAHAPLLHSHGHFPDIHHRHRH